MPQFQELLNRLDTSLSFLPDKPEETATSTLRALWFAATGSPRSADAAMEGTLPELSGPETARLDGLIARRLAGEPLSHITGRQRFMGMEMIATPDALVPRKETELLADVAIRLTQDAQLLTATPLILDVCTGAGNVAIAVAHRVSGARVLGADLSESAVELARRNALQLGVADRVEFRAGDLLTPFNDPKFLGRVDVLTCNPPYISSAKVKQMNAEIGEHEPQMAFDGGPFGVGILMRLLKEAPPFLRPGAWLAFEVGLGQGPAMVKRISGMQSFQQVETALDSAGDIRTVFARSRTS